MPQGIANMLPSSAFTCKSPAQFNWGWKLFPTNGCFVAPTWDEFDGFQFQLPHHKLTTRFRSNCPTQQRSQEVHEPWRDTHACSHSKSHCWNPEQWKLLTNCRHSEVFHCSIYSCPFAWQETQQHLPASPLNCMVSFWTCVSLWLCSVFLLFHLYVVALMWDVIVDHEQHWRLSPDM